MAGLDPSGPLACRDVCPGAAADGDRQARTRLAECQDGRAIRPGRWTDTALSGLEHVRDRVGELPTVTPRRRDLLKQVKQVVGGLAVVQAAEQDQVSVPGQHSVTGHGEEPRDVPACGVLAHTSLPP